MNPVRQALIYYIEQKQFFYWWLMFWLLLAMVVTLWDEIHSSICLFILKLKYNEFYFYCCFFFFLIWCLFYLFTLADASSLSNFLPMGTTASHFSILSLCKHLQRISKNHLQLWSQVFQLVTVDSIWFMSPSF